MTCRDRAWRVVGFLAMGAGYAVPLAGDMIVDGRAEQMLAVLIGMPLALTGALLMVQGDRVVRILRVERSRHRDLILAMRVRRRSRSASGQRRFGREFAD